MVQAFRVSAPHLVPPTQCSEHLFGKNEVEADAEPEIQGQPDSPDRGVRTHSVGGRRTRTAFDVSFHPI